MSETITDDTRLHHVCEVCGLDEILTPAQAFEAGWDYPPRMGQLGVIGPRTCGNCPINRTVWWALACEGYTAEMLSEAEKETIARILAEPASILVTAGEASE